MILVKEIYKELAGKEPVTVFSGGGDCGIDLFEEKDHIIFSRSMEFLRHWVT